MNGVGDGPLELQLQGRAFNAEDTIPIPMSKLLIIQDNLQRAEHAVVCGMTGMVEASKKLDQERRILKRTIDVVSNITGVSPTHCM